MKLSGDKSGSDKPLSIGKEAISDKDRRLVRTLNCLLRPSYLLALGILAATTLGVWHVYSKRSVSSLAIPVPANLDRLDPQLRAYLQEKLDWVRAKPRDAKRQATLGIVYAANGLWQEARAAFQNTSLIEPREPLAQMYVGVAELESGYLPEATELFRNLTARFPDFPQGHYRLGDAQLRAGLLAEAEESFRRLVALAPAEWRGYAGLGDINLRKKNPSEAANLLEKATRLAPNEKIAHHLLGSVYRELGRSADAERELSLGLGASHYPMPDAWSVTAYQHMKLLPDQFGMATQFIEAGQPAKAVDVLETALRFHPDSLNVRTHLAIAYNKSNHPDKGRRLLLKVIEKDPTNVSALVALAFSCTALEFYDEALSWAEKAISLGPNVAQSHLAKANVLLAMERDNEAVAVLESAFGCDPSNPQIQMETGDVLWRNLSRPTEALERYKTAIAIQPAFAPAYVRLADLQIQMGQTEDARRTLETLRKLPVNPEELATLERSLRRVQNQ